MVRRLKAAEWLPPMAFLAGMLVSLFINHRSYLGNFNLVPGDLGDTRLVVFTLEHWYKVFQGKEAFFFLNLFYPDPHALGYADAWFLFGIPYAMARALGADYFTSYQLLLPLLTIVGYAAWFRVLRELLGLQRSFAILGAVLLTGMNSLQMMADHGKFSAMHLYPVLILLMWNVARIRRADGWRAAVSMCGFGAGLALLFFTAFYPAWFFTLTLTILALVAAVMSVAAEGFRRTSAKLAEFVRRRGSVLAAGGVAFGLSILPFAITYGPLIRSHEVRGVDLVLGFAPRIIDIVNVSNLNFVWSPILRSLGFNFGGLEVQLGSPLLVLLISVAATLTLWRRMRRSGWDRAPALERCLLMLAITAVILVAISVKFNGWSLWFVVYKLVPGASAIRAIGRILMIMDMIVIVLAMYGLQTLQRGLASSGGHPAILLDAGFGILAALLVAEQANGMTFRLKKAEQLIFMNRFAAPAETCKAFYVNNAATTDLPFGYYQLDAMMIGMHRGLPTINGYSGFEPDAAFTLIPKGVEYRYRVMGWLMRSGAMAGICELDLQTGRYRPLDVAEGYAAARDEYRMELLENFSALVEAAQRALADGHSAAELYPQKLEHDGYLDPALGYQSGTRYRWIQDRYWIGERACGNQECFGVAVVGTYGDLSAIVDQYAGGARQVYFPNPERFNAGLPPADEVQGELLMVFSRPSK